MEAMPDWGSVLRPSRRCISILERGSIFMGSIWPVRKAFVKGVDDVDMVMLRQEHRRGSISVDDRMCSKLVYGCVMVMRGGG